MASSPIFSQVQYTDISPDAVVNATPTGEQVDLDLDGDTQTDISIAAVQITVQGYPVNVSVSFLTDDVSALLATPNAGSPSLKETSPLADAFFVDPTASTWVDTTASANEYYQRAYLPDLSQNLAGLFSTSLGDRYVGVRFAISGVVHYGWVLINVPDDGTTTTIKEYAYNPTPGQGLYTGHTNNLENLVYSNWTAGVNGKTIVIGSAVDGEYTVVDASGRVVASGEVVNGKATASIDEAGIFVVSFSGAAGIGTKKVVLN